LIERLKLIADDPMWADHAEISKATVRRVIAALSDDAKDKRIAALEAERDEAQIARDRAGFAGTVAQCIGRLSSDLDSVHAELSAVSIAIGSVRFMDPPDGGDVSLPEQVRRMREALSTAEAELARIKAGTEDGGEPANDLAAIIVDAVRNTRARPSGLRGPYVITDEELDRLISNLTRST
jgi:hypothetical protein